MQKNKVDILAEQLQDDCHKTVDVIMKNLPNATYQDATNVWIFRKLAELELRVRKAGKEILYK